jgi:elongator complex protein 3
MGQGRNYLLIYLRVAFFAKIAVVAVMCKPHRCPHIAMTGNICVYVSNITVLMGLMITIF